MAPRLDRFEATFKRGARQLMGARLRAMEPVVDQILRSGRLPDGGVVVPGAADHLKLVGEFVRELLVDGMVNADEEMQVLRGVERQFFGPAVTSTQTVEPVVPNEAVNFVRNRQVLAGKWNRDLDGSVTQVLAAALEQGATTKETMDALREVFPAFADRRLENIARTESTAAFNQGRLATFRQQGDFIPAVQFLAVLDTRTTGICRARNGLIMRLDDERLVANTPPLHFMCRSLLSPVTKYELARLERGDAAAEKRAFGWVAPREVGLPPAPSTLEEALDGWERAKEPLPGFGGELVAKSPAASTPLPTGASSKPIKGQLPKRKRWIYPDGINPDADDVVEVSEEEVRKVHDYYFKRHKDDSLDEEDVRYVAAYLLNPGSVDEDAWANILHFDEIGYGVIKHETKEIEQQLLDKIDPLNQEMREDNTDKVLTAHALGLLEEARYHQKLASRYNRVATLGDFIASNPAGESGWDIEMALEFASEYLLEGESLKDTPDGRLTAAFYFDMIRPKE